MRNSYAVQFHIQSSTLIFITDHDNIEAALSLRVLDECRHLSLTTLFANYVPGSVQILLKGLSIARHGGVRPMFRYAFPQGEELAL